MPLMSSPLNVLTFSTSYVQFSKSSFTKPVFQTRNPVLQTMTHLCLIHVQFYKPVQFYKLIEKIKI